MNPPQPNPSTAATIVIKTTMARKSAYVRSSSPNKLVPSLLDELDKWAKSKGHDPGPPHKGGE